MTRFASETHHADLPRHASSDVFTRRRAHATGVGLRVQSLSTHTPKVAPLPKNGVTLPPTQRWKLSPDDVSAEVTAEITLVGPRPLIERFIDEIGRAHV